VKGAELPMESSLYLFPRRGKLSKPNVSCLKKRKNDAIASLEITERKESLPL
jgi:hypothetical protein